MKENLPPSIRIKMIEDDRRDKVDLVTWQRILTAKGWATPEHVDAERQRLRRLLHIVAERI